VRQYPAIQPAPEWLIELEQIRRQEQNEEILRAQKKTSENLDSRRRPITKTFSSSHDKEKK
jgi:hypothetical protein